MMAEAEVSPLNQTMANPHKKNQMIILQSPLRAYSITLGAWVHFLRSHLLKRGILFACTPETDAIFNYF